jgi:serine protease Do
MRAASHQREYSLDSKALPILEIGRRPGGKVLELMPLLQKMKQPKLLSVALLSATLIIGIFLGQILDTRVRAARDIPAVAAPDATPLSVPQAVPVGNEFSKLAKKLEPSVVSIQADYIPKAKPGKKGPKSDEEDPEEDSQGGDPSDMLKKFFGQGQPQPKNLRPSGSGTGFIVDRNGYILTNNHVVEHADRLKVKMHGDENEYRARVIGTDSETDLAVIKIDAKKELVPVQMGNSEALLVGDWAVAIGSPFGLDATVTAGIVSATGRDLQDAKAFQHFIQTDAAINPGNSGGPLLNIRGEVIGVNTMIATRSGGYEGIGFALPSNMAVKVYNDIIKSGRVVRGSIGIRWRKADNRETLQAFGLDHGVLVEEAPKQLPAGRAGVKDGDVIVSLNDRPVQDGDELVNKVADMPIGSNTLLTVDRDGKKIDFKVPIEERASVWRDEPVFASEQEPGKPKSIEPAQAKFGITITRVTDKERQELGIEDKAGVRVVGVDAGSFADDIGAQEGDVIISVNRQPVTSPADVTAIQATLKPGQPVAVRVVRSGTFGGQKMKPFRLYLSGRLPSE